MRCPSLRAPALSAPSPIPLAEAPLTGRSRSTGGRLLAQGCALLALWMPVRGLSQAPETPVTPPAPALLPQAEAPAAPGEAALPSGQGWSVAPVPDWVAPIEPDLEAPAPYRPDISEGLYFRLVDMQAHTEKRELYQRFVDEYRTLAGVHDNGVIEIPFDPNYQRLFLHHFKLRRNGQEEEMLPRLEFRLVNPEKNLEAGQFNGHKSLHVLLTGIRQGDILDYAYTLAGDNPAFVPHYCHIMPMAWGSPIGKLRCRVVKGPDRSLNWRGLGASLDPRTTALPNGETELLWEQKDVPATLVEPTLPDWYQPYTRLLLSDFASWEEVAAWGAPLYAISGEAPANVKAVAGDILARNATQEARVLAAIRYVQDEIRYLGLEDGEAAYLPKPPEATCRLLFGDCKDKTLLLRRLLAELGQPSEPVFVSTTRRRHLAEELPSPLAFDHVILRLLREGKEPVYVDATQSLTGGGLDHLAVTDFGKGLPVTPDSPGLVDLPTPPAAEHAVVSHEVWEVDARGKGRLTTTTVYTGAEAEEQRYYLQATHPDSLHADYLEYYRDNHPGILADGQVEIQDDREANRLTVIERYRMEPAWTPDHAQPDYEYLRLQLTLLTNPLSQPKNPERAMPYATQHPMHHTQIVEVRLPPPAGRWQFQEEHHHLEAGPLSFSRDVTQEGATLTIRGRLQSSDDHVAPASAREFRDRLDDLADLCSYTIWNVDEESTAEALEALTAEAPPTEEPEAASESDDGNALSEEDKMGLMAGTMIVSGAAGLMMGVILGAAFTALLVLFFRRRRAPGSAPPPLPGRATGVES